MTLLIAMEYFFHNSSNLKSKIEIYWGVDVYQNDLIYVYYEL